MITITIKTDNSAFEEDRAGEVARILARLAHHIDPAYVGKCAPAHLYDSNGNKVGMVRLTGKDRAL